MDVEKIENKIHEIAAILKNCQTDNNNIGVLEGSAGVALFHYYYDRCYPSRGHDEIGDYLIFDAVESINKGFDIPTFCSGIAGFAWTIQLLTEEDFIELEADSLLQELDKFYENILSFKGNGIYYDFLHGLLGITYYFLKRFHNTNSKCLKERYLELLSVVLERFENTALRDSRGIYWISHIKGVEVNLKGVNLSLSHGLSSIINILSRIGQIPQLNQRVLPLLTGAINFILYYANHSKSSFPDWVSLDGNIRAGNRLAWCYGELGIGLSLLHAADFLEDDSLKNRSITILKKAALKRDIENIGVVDAGICHGAFGIAHVFNSIYRKTKLPIFNETSSHWISIGLKMATHEEGLAGYRALRDGNGGKPTYEDEYHLLDGVAGIGLVLINHLHPKQHKWDQCLLIGS